MSEEHETIRGEEEAWGGWWDEEDGEAGRWSGGDKVGRA